MRRVALIVGLTAIMVLAAPASASAHPLGNFTVNLYAGVVATPGRIQISYVLDMAEIPTLQEIPNIDTDGNGTVSPAERAAWAARTAPRLAAGLVVAVDGRRLPLRVVSSSMRFRPGQAGLEILRLEATFTAAVSRTGSVAVRETNYADRIGWREITAFGAVGEAVRGSNVPARSISDQLLAYPKALLSSPLRTTVASFRIAPGDTGPIGRQAAAPPNEDRPGVTGGAFARLATWSRLTPWVLLSAMLLALGFGAAHALLPGHGKTIMAAYLVGAGGRIRQAVSVGTAVALMHTASVIVIGVIVLSAERLFAPERVYPWLTLASGLVIVGLGAGLLRSRIRARRGAEESAHAAEPHEHPHGHEHAHGQPAGAPLTRKGLAALALSGGLLPSPTALVVLLSTEAAHRLVFGLALILSFSVGMAGALTVVGVLALRTRDAVSRRLRGRVGGLVPVGSAAVIVGVGAVLLARAAVQL